MPAADLGLAGAGADASGCSRPARPRPPPPRRRRRRGRASRCRSPGSSTAARRRRGRRGAARRRPARRRRTPRGAPTSGSAAIAGDEVAQLGAVEVAAGQLARSAGRPRRVHRLPRRQRRSVSWLRPCRPSLPCSAGSPPQEPRRVGDADRVGGGVAEELGQRLGVGPVAAEHERVDARAPGPRRPAPAGRSRRCRRTPPGRPAAGSPPRSACRSWCTGASPAPAANSTRRRGNSARPPTACQPHQAACSCAV